MIAEFKNDVCDLTISGNKNDEVVITVASTRSSLPDEEWESKSFQEQMESYYQIGYPFDGKVIRCSGWADALSTVKNLKRTGYLVPSSVLVTLERLAVDYRTRVAA